MQVAILIESQAEEPLAHQISTQLKQFDLKSEIYMVSGLKTPELVVDLVNDFNRSGSDLVYIVISPSPTLAGMVSASSFHPVIALNAAPDAVLFNFPRQAPAMTVHDPENAVTASVKILAMENVKLKKHIARNIEEMKEDFTN